MTKQVQKVPRVLLGKKCRMVQIFDETGTLVPCTAISVEPNVITQIKTQETDGYVALQLATEEVVVKDARTLEKRFSKPLRGHFEKTKTAPRRHLVEARCEELSGMEEGQVLDLSVLEGAAFVDVIGTSKGKGYQGVMKLHNFRGGPAAHGSGFHRHAGSTGMRSTPGRCLPGGKRASHMGDERKTVQNLEVIAMDKELNLLFVRGAVPGARGGLLVIRQAMKKPQQKK